MLDKGLLAGNEYCIFGAIPLYSFFIYKLETTLATEQSKIWINQNFKGIELLSANYQQFEFSKHWHDELAIGIIEEGAEGLLYRGENLLVPSQHIVAINPGEIHTGFAGTERGWRYRMFYFDLNTLTDLFANSDLAIEPIIEQPIIFDAELYQQLLALHISLEISSLQITKDSLLSIALENLFSRYGALSSHENQFQPDTFSAKMARDYINDNWQRSVSLAELEKLTGCSKFKLIRSFNNVYGLTPHQYLLIIKIRNAKTLLTKGLSLIETALSCGFYDQSHFHRNFKRAFGIPLPIIYPVNFCNFVQEKTYNSD